MANTVLFVDDEDLMLDALRRQVGRKHNVLTAKGGEEALQLLGNNPDIEVVVADMRMPMMTGLELLGRVRDRFPKAIRVMLTGNLDRKTAEDAVHSAEVFNYLTKPCETSALLNALQMCFDLHGVQMDLDQMAQH